MNVQEEDRQNKNCPSRGLGLAAAAIGVGVGAALYYFFSKRPENPNEEGSTSTWQCEQAQAFTEDEFEDSRHGNHSDDSYTTLSEHSTTDTSIHTSPVCGNSIDNDNESSDNSDEDNDYQTDQSFMSAQMENGSSVTSDTEVDSISSESDEAAILDDNSDETVDSINDSDLNNEWDMTYSSFDVPIAAVDNNYHFANILDRFQAFVSPRNRRNRLTEEEQMERARAFRERSWSLEECSICFDVILKNQEVMSLPCTHHFHTACILPWLQEQQTCPNCRKAAE